MENMETPEGKLIGQATKAARKSVRKVAEQAGISEGRWRQIVKGYQAVSADVVVPVKAPAGTLAKMAQAVGVSPDALRSAGREDAAETLESYDESDVSSAGYQWSDEARRIRIGKLAKQRREEIGLSREAFVARAGLKSPQTIQNFEFARAMPHGENLRRIEEILEWKYGSVDEAIGSGKRAGDIVMEDMDKYDRSPSPRPLASFSTEEVLAEAIRRLTEFRGALGPAKGVVDAQFLYGLAANNDPSHLEREAEEGGE